MLAVGVVSLLMWPVTLGRYYGILAVEHDLQYSRVSIEMQGSQEWRERERLN
jgi:hypothetical protein